MTGATKTTVAATTDTTAVAANTRTAVAVVALFCGFNNEGRIRVLYGGDPYEALYISVGSTKK